MVALDRVRICEFQARVAQMAAVTGPPSEDYGFTASGWSQRHAETILTTSQINVKNRSLFETQSSHDLTVRQCVLEFTDFFIGDVGGLQVHEMWRHEVINTN